MCFFHDVSNVQRPGESVGNVGFKLLTIPTEGLLIETGVRAGSLLPKSIMSSLVFPHVERQVVFMTPHNVGYLSPITVVPSANFTMLIVGCLATRSYV